MTRTSHRLGANISPEKDRSTEEIDNILFQTSKLIPKLDRHKLPFEDNYGNLPFCGCRLSLMLSWRRCMFSVVASGHAPGKWRFFLCFAAGWARCFLGGDGRARCLRWRRWVKQKAFIHCSAYGIRNRDEPWWGMNLHRIESLSVWTVCMTFGIVMNRSETRTEQDQRPFCFNSLHDIWNRNRDGSNVGLLYCSEGKVRVSYGTLK